MKAGREHRVPLSPPAIALLKSLPRMAGTNLVFPAPRGGALSDMTLAAVLRRMKVSAVPHGFRFTFRDWASEGPTLISLAAPRLLRGRRVRGTRSASV